MEVMPSQMPGEGRIGDGALLSRSDGAARAPGLPASGAGANGDGADAEPRSGHRQSSPSAHPRGHRRPPARLPALPARGGRQPRRSPSRRSGWPRWPGSTRPRCARTSPTSGSYGTRGVGYDVEYLLVQINRVLGLTQDWPVVIVGIGNLGHALANYKGFSARGFRIVALVDADRVQGGRDHRRPRRPPPRRPARHRRRGRRSPSASSPRPAASAQDVADRLVAAGVTSILNFAPAVITVPPGVSLRKVDLSIELQILSFYQQRRAGRGGGRRHHRR